MNDDSFMSSARSDYSDFSFRSDDSAFSFTSVQESVKHKTFWHIFMMLTLSMSYPYFMKVACKNLGALYHNDDKYLTTVVSFAFFGGASARFLWGVL